MVHCKPHIILMAAGSFLLDMWNYPTTAAKLKNGETIIMHSACGLHLDTSVADVRSENIFRNMLHALNIYPSKELHKFSQNAGQLPCPCPQPIHKNQSHTNSIYHLTITAYIALLNNQRISHWQLGLIVMEGEKVKIGREQEIWAPVRRKRWRTNKACGWWSAVMGKGRCMDADI